MVIRTASSLSCVVLVTIASAALLERTLDASLPRAEQFEGGARYSFNDPVARLGRQLERGDTELQFDPNGFGYLPSLLRSLDINVDSQLLAFSKTSLQAELISPEAPRAVFFNDNVSVGSVQGGRVFELAGLDPREGIVFYTLDKEASPAPRFIRRSGECEICHRRELMVTTVYPKPNGTFSLMGVFFALIDQAIPFDLRWGGWYVTGTHGAQRHMGNAFAPNPERPFELDFEGSQNVTSLEGRFDTTKYLSPTSDIVALMTFGHQARMTNLITRANAEFRAARTTSTLDSRTDRLNAALDALVVHMVFADEVPLRSPVSGVSSFAETFPERGPRDTIGRSLRDFDLETRLFRYPLSYMIYSETFDGMDAGARERVYRRLYAILTGDDTDERYSHVSLEDRHVALDILRDTKSNLPDYWTAGGP
jgi:hypothetical protein